MPLLMYACPATVKAVHENEHTVIKLVMHIRSAHIGLYPCACASIKLCIYVLRTIYDGISIQYTYNYIHEKKYNVHA